MPTSKSIRSSSLLLLALLASPVWGATTWYIGGFTACGGVAGAGSCLDDAGCGNSAANACATLSWFRRQQVVANGDTVRFAPGTYTTAGTNNAVDRYHCIKGVPNSTWEGRTAADGATTNSGLVVIDATHTPNTLDGNEDCEGTPLGCWGGGCDFTNMIVRAMTWSGGIRNAWFQANGCSGVGGKCSGLHLGPDFRFTQSLGARGLDIGDNACGHGATCGRDTTNVTIDDVEIDNNAAHGLYIGDVDGITIKNSIIHDNGAAFCDHCPGGGSCVSGICAGGTNAGKGCDKGCNNTDTCIGVCAVGGGVCDTTPGSPTQGHCVGGGEAGHECDCTDSDGVNWTAGINGFFQDTDAYKNRQLNLDISRTSQSDDCEATSFNVTVQRNTLHEAGYAQLGVSGCDHDVTIKNNILWGTAANPSGGLDFKSGSCKVNVWDNTINVPDGDFFKFFSAHSQFDIRGNILNGYRANNAWIGINYTFFTTGGHNTWDYNIVNNNNATGSNIKCTQFQDRYEDANHVVSSGAVNACNGYINDSDFACDKPTCSQSSLCASEVFFNNDTGVNGVQKWQAFQSLNLGAHDLWGTANKPIYAQNPLVTPSVANLKIGTAAPQDGAGVDLRTSGVGEDYDTELRCPTDDIGADTNNNCAGGGGTTSTSTTSTSTTSSSTTSVAGTAVPVSH